MAQYSVGQRWEDMTRRRQELENRKLAAQRAAAYRAELAQIDAPHFPHSVSAGLSADLPQRLQDPRLGFRRRQEDMPELEARGTPPPQYRWQDPVTPTASSSEAPHADSSEQIRNLQEVVTDKESKIKELQSEVEVERNRRRRLRAERHDLVDAQRRANDELCRLRREVSNLDEILDASVKREKELESQLDLARQEVRDLKRQLHEERCNYESEIRAKELRERRVKQQLEDTHCALEDEIRRNRCSAADFANRQVHVEAPSAVVAATPSRARKSDRSTSGRAFISIPKGRNRRANWIFG